MYPSQHLASASLHILMEPCSSHKFHCKLWRGDNLILTQSLECKVFQCWHSNAAMGKQNIGRSIYIPVTRTRFPATSPVPGPAIMSYTAFLSDDSCFPVFEGSTQKTADLDKDFFPKSQHLISTRANSEKQIPKPRAPPSITVLGKRQSRDTLDSWFREA